MWIYPASRGRWTVDEHQDFVVKNILEHFGSDYLFSWEDVLELSKSKPWLFVENMEGKRNMGSELS